MATFHLAMNGYRLLRGYADERLSPGGPVAYIGNLKLWDHILKDTIYATQENLGSAAAWIKTFYSIAVVLNIITTGLMGYRIYITHKRSANYSLGQGRLLSILRILVESAALQLIVEIVLLALYCSNIDAQYILLETVTPIVAITFNSITVRIKLQSAAENMKTMQSSNGHVNNPVQTIGSIPMKRIHVNIDREIDDDTGYGSSVYKDKP
ncbi:hypothetical protein CVT25_006233 [Psilocybe cyanescens]|uniref:Uncharacterized protein n=1 Tax=Psilocybe cyanescens TaxID=93625 RepID=A0A409XKM6_PSICY|nr:hypothetical protein CVT25_006233 [Psilocybe cyanescens]